MKNTLQSLPQILIEAAQRAQGPARGIARTAQDVAHAAKSTARSAARCVQGPAGGCKVDRRTCTITGLVALVAAAVLVVSLKARRARAAEREAFDRAR